MTASPAVVAITHRSDAHLPFVQRHLPEPIVVIDHHSLLEGNQVTYRLGKTGMSCTYGKRRLNPGTVAGVWYRKPLPFKMVQLPVAPVYEAYTRRALEVFAEQIYSQFTDALWVSDYYAELRANNKTLQLAVARRLGFRVPATIFTSSARAAKAFLQAHPASITKSVSGDSVRRGNKFYIFFTSKVAAARPDLTGLHLAPAIFQQAIAIDRELRITVVGNQAFAATVTGSAVDAATSATRDWRVAHFRGDIRIEQFDLPRSVAKRCVTFVREMGLRYGAIDMILDKKGIFWFLENNPNGQWAFVEEHTGQPIGKAMAHLLMSGSNQRAGRVGQRVTV